jgi:acetolactate synthase regulatory subunit
VTHRHLLRTMGRGLEALARSAAAAEAASAAEVEVFTTSQRRKRLLRTVMDVPRVAVLVGAAATVAAELVGCPTKGVPQRVSSSRILRQVRNRCR